ncbi:hypothetical protein SNEBB_005095 [Seison nebaliae]|nr:hypothetical protein SNEBB_005095 [Seison nebaliae]
MIHLFIIRSITNNSISALRTTALHRQEEIEKANRRLVENIAKIELRTSHRRMPNSTTTINRTPRNIPKIMKRYDATLEKPSIDDGPLIPKQAIRSYSDTQNRLRLENEKLFLRIIKTKPYVSTVSEHRKDFQKHLVMKNRLTKIPNIKNINQKKYRRIGRQMDRHNFKVLPQLFQSTTTSLQSNVIDNSFSSYSVNDFGGKQNFHSIKRNNSTDTISFDKEKDK